MSEAAVLYPKLTGCPICGAPPRRERRKSGGCSVVCYAGSHILRVNADDQRQADQQWNDMAADWAARQDGAKQIALSQSVTEAIADMEHAARKYDSGLNTGAASLRQAARVLHAAIAAERQRAEQAEQKLAEAKEQFDLHVVWASDCSAAVERQIEALGEALYRLSGPLRSSGFIENSDNHQLYEAVVAAFREIGWKPDPLDEAIRSAASGEVE